MPSLKKLPLVIRKYINDLKKNFNEEMKKFAVLRCTLIALCTLLLKTVFIYHKTYS